MQDGSPRRSSLSHTILLLGPLLQCNSKLHKFKGGRQQGTIPLKKLAEKQSFPLLFQQVANE